MIYNIGGEKMKCEKCGSENVVDGKLITNLDALSFSTMSLHSKFPFTKKTCLIIASACKDCGRIFDLRAENNENIGRTK